MGKYSYKDTEIKLLIHFIHMTNRINISCFTVDGDLSDEFDGEVKLLKKDEKRLEVLIEKQKDESIEEKSYEFYFDTIIKVKINEQSCRVDFNDHSFHLIERVLDKEKIVIS